jgi:hypothetical protein
MCGNTPCHISPAECKKSRERIVAGKYFVGENRENMKRVTTGYHYHGPAQLDLPKSEDLLYRKVNKSLSADNCAICKHVFMGSPQLDMTGPQLRLITKEAIPEYIVSPCGHAFHEACLYSYLTEPSELNFTDCDKCEVIRAYVRVKGWNALVVEVAIYRLEKVMAGGLAVEAQVKGKSGAQ